jgi:hypothetical protein
MATVTKAPRAPRAPRAAKQPAPVAAPVAAPVLLALPQATVANPLAALQAALAPAPVVQAMVQAPVPAVAVLAPAGHAGVAWANLTKSQQAIAQAKGGVHIAPALAKAPALVLGQVAYRVRSGNNAFWWQCCMQAMQAQGGHATAQHMVAAGACPKFVGYAVARGWLAPLPA